MTIKAYSIDEIVEERILDEKQESNIQELFKFLIGDQRSHLSVKCILPPEKQNNASVLNFIKISPLIVTIFSR